MAKREWFVRYVTEICSLPEDDSEATALTADRVDVAALQQRIAAGRLGYRPTGFAPTVVEFDAKGRLVVAGTVPTESHLDAFELAMHAIQGALLDGFDGVPSAIVEIIGVEAHLVEGTRPGAGEIRHGDSDAQANMT